MAYAFQESLKNYIDQSDLNLLIASAVIPTTLKYVNLKPGIKGTKNLNIISSTVKFQDGAACGLTSSDSTDFSARPITTYPVKVTLDYCEYELEDIFAQQKLTAGANGYDEVAFAEYIAADINKKIHAKIDDVLWNGKRNEPMVTDRDYWDGFLTIIEDVEDLNASGSTVINSSTVREVFDTVHEAIPAAVKNEGDAIIYCGLDVFGTLKLALANANLFNFSPDATAPKNELQLPWYDAKIVGQPGLSGTKTIYASSKKNSVVGCDIEADPQNYKWVYVEKDEKYYFTVRFRFGTQVAFLNEVVKFIGK